MNWLTAQLLPHLARPSFIVLSAAFGGLGLVTLWLLHSLKRAWRSNHEIAAANLRMTQELELPKRMLESIIEYSPVAIALLDGPEFTHSLVNPAYQALMPAEPIAGGTLASVWPAAAPVLLPLLNIAREAETVYHADALAVPVHRGETRYLDFSLVPTRNSSGNGGMQILVCALDVTERKRDEMSLRDAYSQLAAIQANAPVVLLVMDRQLRVLEANELASRLAGRDVAAMMGNLPGDALGCANAFVNSRGCGRGPSCGQCLLRRTVLDTLNTGVNHDGVEAWLSLRVDDAWQQRCLVFSTTAIKRGEETQVLLCAQDITGRKHSERELARQNEELQRQAELINLSHDAIITADAGRVILSWNRGAEEVYGYTAAEAVGHVMHVLLQSKKSVTPAQVDEIIFRQQHWNGEVEQSRKDGERILLDSRQVVLRDKVGAGLRILVINRDVTDRRRAEKVLVETVRKLESAVAEKTVLLQEVHHRVKNNLAVTASLLSMKADLSSADTRVALEDSQQRVHSIALVHEQLYDCDRLDRIDFAEYTRKLAEGVYSTYAGDRRGIALDFNLDAVEVGIERAVPCALILNELLSNAFKYAFTDGRAGRITISLRQPEPGWCELGVEDNGVGLPDAALEKHDNSLGLRIVAILSTQVDGSVERRASSGTHMVLRFPAAA